jgi:hypothetical protein
MLKVLESLEFDFSQLNYIGSNTMRSFFQYVKDIASYVAALPEMLIILDSPYQHICPL